MRAKKLLSSRQIFRYAVPARTVTKKALIITMRHYTVSQKNWTHKTGWYNLIKSGPLWMIFHKMHWHLIANWLCLKSFIWVECHLCSYHGNNRITHTHSRWQLFVNEKFLIWKGYGAQRLIKEFPTKSCKKTTLNDFLKQISGVQSRQLSMKNSAHWRGHWPFRWAYRKTHDKCLIIL